MTTYFPGILSNGALVPGLAAGTVRDNLGLGTADSPTFAGGTFTEQVALPAGTVSLPAFKIGSFQTGFFEGTVGRLNLTVSGTQIMEFRTNRVTIAGSAGLHFGSSTQLVVNTSNILAQRNGTNAQTLEVYKTYTSSTSNERLAFDTTEAGFYDIVAARGSAGGAENGIRIGGKLDGGSFVPWVSFATSGQATFVAITNTGGQQGSEVFGDGATVSGISSVVIGKSATAANNAVAIGRQSTAGGSGTAVGFSANAGSSSTAVGVSASAPNSSGVSVGTSATAGIHGVSVGMSSVSGTYATAIGRSAIANHTDSISIGRGATSTKGNQLTFGSPTYEITEIVFPGGSATFADTINPRASTTAADTAPIKLPTGVLQTTPEAGAIEYDGTNLYFTDSVGTRRTLAVV